jgi:hypothetical protein
MSILSALLCLSIVLVLAVVVIVQVASPRNKKGTPRAGSNRGWRSWIFYVAVALLISLWTMAGALYFLAVVWISRLDPKPYSKEISFPTNAEKKSARILYAWLMLSSFLTVPLFMIALFSLSSNATINERVLAALIPLIFHIPLLFGLSSKSTFVFRHTQQAILLISIRAGLASLSVSVTSDSFVGILLFLFGNGALWLVGSLWGWNQIRSGDCWLMKRKGHKLVSAEAARVIVPEINPQLEDVVKSLDAKEVRTTKSQALQSFRSGNPEVRKRAVEVLAKLGEVETF